MAKNQTAGATVEPYQLGPTYRQHPDVGRPGQCRAVSVKCRAGEVQGCVGEVQDRWGAEPARCREVEVIGLVTGVRRQPANGIEANIVESVHLEVEMLNAGVSGSPGQPENGTSGDHLANRYRRRTVLEMHVHAAQWDAADQVGNRDVVSGRAVAACAIDHTIRYGLDGSSVAAEHIDTLVESFRPGAEAIGLAYRVIVRPGDSRSFGWSASRTGKTAGGLTWGNWHDSWGRRWCWRDHNVVVSGDICRCEAGEFGCLVGSP